MKKLFVLLCLIPMIGQAAECHLRQSTASQEVLIGPFKDSTDGVTNETGLTISNTDIRLSPAGGNIVPKNSGGGTHDELGWYQITLDATDTATVGTLDIIVEESGALQVYKSCYVYEENVYDMVYAASGDLGTTVDAILTDTGTTLDGKIDAVDDYVDTEVAAIKAKTDSLTFTNTGEVDANTKSLNDAEVCGDGTDGDPWADCP